MDIKAPRSPTLIDGLRRIAGQRIERRAWLAGASLALLGLAFLAGHFIWLPRELGEWVRGLRETQPSEIVRRLRAPLASAPRLSIDIKQTHYQKLQWKREQALARGLILTSDDSYVPARVTVGGQTARVRMRLKGDYPDHLEGDKWSFRIKVRDGAALMGMRRFSIQDPKRSGWIKEWILHRWLAHEGLIGLRYRFVDVWLNGEDLGVFALEESFGKELIEHNRRRDAPVLKFDEALLIDPEKTNRGDRSEQADIFFAADIISFDTAKIFRNAGLEREFLDGRSLLWQLRQGDAPLREVMDVPAAARIFAMQEILGVQHALRWKNARFYFNPVSRRLELIAYNAYGPGLPLPEVSKLFYQRWRERDLGPYYVFEWIDRFFEDPEFQEHYFRELVRITEPGYLESFFAAIEPELARELEALRSDGAPRQVGVEDYLRNRDAVRELLEPRLPIQVALGDFDAADRVLHLVVVNRGFLPVSLRALRCAGSAEAIAIDRRLEGRASGRPADPELLEIRDVGSGIEACLGEVVRVDDVMRLAGLALETSLPGGARPRTAPVEAHAWTAALSPIPARKGDADSLADLVARGIVAVDEAAREIRIRPGSWRIDRDAVLPAGYRVIGVAGTTLDLAAGAALISFAPVDFSGSGASPFAIRSEDGSGQGLVVVSAAGPSSLRHVAIEGQGSLTRPGWSLTGAVTFYESDVRIEHSRFAGSRSEDLVNLIRSDFAISASQFTDSHSDALDVDFGGGSIDASVFERCGNDCIDLSQSETRIRDVKIAGAGDKGISVGEKSRVRLEAGEIDAADIGIACKDASQLEIAGLRVARSAVGIAAYQKKPEFDGGSVHASDVVWADVATPLRADPRSSIFVDDRRLAGAGRIPPP